jgi:TonB family protein
MRGLWSRLSFIVVFSAVWACALPAGAQAQECPFRFTTFSYAGQTARQRLDAYELDADIRSRSLAGIRFQVFDRQGSPLLFQSSPSAAAQGSDFSARLLLDPGVQPVRVEPIGYQPAGAATAVACTGTAVTLASDSTGTVTTFADPPVPVQAPAMFEVHPPRIRDPDFRNKIYPQYPHLTAMKGITGTAIVEVDIQTDGRADNVVIDDSSQDETLDLAAVAAARASTYRPPESNGQPVKRSYLIEYDFRLDSGGFERDTGCGARLRHAWVAGLDPPNNLLLYDILLGSRDGRATSVDLDLRDAQNTLLGTVHAANLRWQADSPGKYSSRFFILAQVPPAITVTTRATSNGPCMQYPVLDWDHTDGRLSEALWPPAPVSASPPRVAQSAEFEHLVRPGYPDPTNAGAAIIVVETDSKGKAKQVHIFQETGDPALDAAALRSAQSSTYSKGMSPGLVVVTYHFQPWDTEGAIVPALNGSRANSPSPAGSP